MDTVIKTQCFPFPAADDETSDSSVTSTPFSTLQRRSSNIATGARLLRACYPKLNITDEQIFYYVYGILQCSEFMERFESNLKKEIPRLPAVEKSEDFLAFSTIGEALCNIHMNYEDVEEYPVEIEELNEDVRTKIDDKTKFRVKKMKFVRREYRSVIQYNDFIRVKGIPAETYEFQVNGSSLVEWVMDRQRVSIHGDSGITNDANDFANETMNDPEYPLRLLKKAITVGVKTREIRNSMPPLRIYKKMVG